jgi:hypothetical protein
MSLSVDMAMLPLRLRYLEPVRKQLARLDPDEIHEDTNLTPFRKAVSKRIQELSPTVVAKTLKKDAAELERWLAKPERSDLDRRLLFILLMLPDAEQIIKPPQPEPPVNGTASMNVPEDAKSQLENGCLCVKWKRQLLTVYPSALEDLGRHRGQLRADAKSGRLQNGATMTLTDVNFGDASGMKCVTSIASPPFKRVDYALTVPSGYAIIVIDSWSGKFDETIWEPYFPSLQILNGASV